MSTAGSSFHDELTLVPPPEPEVAVVRNPALVPITLALVAVTLVLTGIIWFRTRRTPSRPHGLLSPGQQANLRLHVWLACADPAAVREGVSQLSALLREFIAATRNWPAQAYTTTELLRSLARSPRDLPNLDTRWRPLLQELDAAAYAGRALTCDDVRRLARDAAALIASTPPEVPHA